MKRHLHGFSVPELVVGLSIAAVVAGMAVPSLQGLARSSRVTAAHNELLGAFGYARSQAARRATPVTVCGSSDLQTCSASADWSSGWIAFTDGTGEPGVVDRTDELLRVWQGQGPAITVRGTAVADPQWVRFSAAGQSLPPRVTKQFEIEPAPCAGPEAQRLRILVEPAGSIRHDRAPCN